MFFSDKIRLMDVIGLDHLPIQVVIFVGHSVDLPPSLFKLNVSHLELGNFHIIVQESLEPLP